MEQPQNYKVILVGDGGVGKSAFLERHVTGEFTRKYIATQGVDVRILSFNTNYGTLTFKVWDCAGQEKFGGLRDGYWLGADAAIIMFDVTSVLTFNNLTSWIQSVARVVDNTPALILGNKVDIEERKVNENMIRDSLGVTINRYYDISAQSNYNLEKPWLHLARELTGHADLQFVEAEPLTAPEIEID